MPAAAPSATRGIFNLSSLVVSLHCPCAVRTCVLGFNAWRCDLALMQPLKTDARYDIGTRSSKESRPDIPDRASRIRRHASNACTGYLLKRPDAGQRAVRADASSRIIPPLMAWCSCMLSWPPTSRCSSITRSSLPGKRCSICVIAEEWTSSTVPSLMISRPLTWLCAHACDCFVRAFSRNACASGCEQLRLNSHLR